MTISIHALVKRATILPYRRPITACNFNPRPREEGDTVLARLKSGSRYFNPHPREEGDRFCKRLLIYRYYFNPRPREEGDAELVDVMKEFAISIHALVKRATHLRMSSLFR